MKKGKNGKKLMNDYEIALETYREIYYAIKNVRHLGVEVFLPEYVQVNGEKFYKDKILIDWLLFQYK